MTKYFRLTDDVALRGRWHLGELVFPGGKELDLLSGKKTGIDRLRVVVQKNGEPLDFSLTAFNLPVVSDRTARVVAGLAAGTVELIPADLGTSSPFWVLNPTEQVNCLDESATHWIKWHPEDGRPELVGQYRSVTGLKVAKERVPAGLAMFRVWGWPVALIVSEEMKRGLESTNTKGAAFTDV
jgi:hypothetical protein